MRCSCITTIMILGVAFFVVTSGFAQERSKNRVAAFKDWNVFVEDNPYVCWSVSVPTEQVNRRDGRAVAVKRSLTQFSVSFLPSQQLKGQVAFTGGYPFASGSTVELKVGGERFELIPGVNENDDEWAWAENSDVDAKIVNAMKLGSKAVLTGKSSLGTDTSDTFSLFGFTAAFDHAQERCSG